MPDCGVRLSVAHVLLASIAGSKEIQGLAHRAGPLLLTRSQVQTGQLPEEE